MRFYVNWDVDSSVGQPLPALIDGTEEEVCAYVRALVDQIHVRAKHPLRDSRDAIVHEIDPSSPVCNFPLTCRFVAYISWWVRPGDWNCLHTLERVRQRGHG